MDISAPRIPILVGARVNLIELRSADASKLVVWMNDPVVTGHLAFFSHGGRVTAEDEIRYIEQMRNSHVDCLFGVLMPEAPHEGYIGTIGLHEIDMANLSEPEGMIDNHHNTARLGILMRPEWSGKGYAADAVHTILRFAFEYLGLNRVQAKIVLTNARGIRFFRKIGFRPEGVEVQAYRRGAQYEDMLRLAILADEWRLTP